MTSKGLADIDNGTSEPSRFLGIYARPSKISHREAASALEGGKCCWKWLLDMVQNGMPFSSGHFVLLQLLKCERLTYSNELLFVNWLFIIFLLNDSFSCGLAY